MEEVGGIISGLNREHRATVTTKEEKRGAVEWRYSVERDSRRGDLVSFD